MFKTWKQTFKANDGTVLPGAKVSVYLAGTTTSVRVFDVNDILHDTAPQLTTDITGLIEFKIDTNDYGTGQLFDIKIQCHDLCQTKDNVDLNSIKLLQDTEGGLLFHRTFVQTTAPTETTLNDKDIWYDSDGGYAMYEYNASAGTWDLVTAGHAFSMNDNDLDDIANGTNYGRVSTTAISDGKIVLTSAGVTGELPTSLTIAKCTDPNADQTSAHNCANPGDYTASHGQNLGWLIGSTGRLTISAGGKLSLNCTDALEIQAAGNMKMLAGGDIDMYSTAANRSKINFYDDGGNKTAELRSGGNSVLGFYSTNTTKIFRIGENNIKWHRFSAVALSIELLALHDSNDYAKIFTYSADGASRVEFQTKRNGTGTEMYFTGAALYPLSDQTINLGTTSYNWNNVYAATYKGSLANDGASIQDRNNHTISFNWTGSQLDFYVDVSNVKTFVIQHPAKAEKYLVHGTLEGPEACVFYRGTGKLEKGYAEINLPDYFEALTHKDGRTIILTTIDRFDKIMIEKQDGDKIKDGKFCVRSENPYSEQEFDWEVKAVRKDVQPLIAEPNKADCNVKGMGPYTYI